MVKVQPKVYVLAETQTDTTSLYDYLESIGAGDWDTDAKSESEGLIEFAGRLCYKSFKPGLNKNVTKVREGNDRYMENVIKSGHGSVLEHATVSFLFADISRVFTHELVRHRVGTAFSQESLRYVRLDELRLWLPEETLKELEAQCGPVAVNEFKKEAEEIFKYLEQKQKRFAEIFGMDDPDNPVWSGPGTFALKKKATSMFRRFAPIGLGTGIVFSTNHRNLRHVLTMRTSRHAEEEIRLVFSQVGRLCLERWPNLYQDFEVEKVDGYDEYRPKHTKI